jgi:hypothetical protein
LEGNTGICHKSRWKRSHNGIADKIKDKAISLCRSTYNEFGPTHASGKLLTVHMIKVSGDTPGMVPRWAATLQVLEKITPPVMASPEGPPREMVQMDESHHDWFEGRGTRCALMGYIDDATGRVYARFSEYKDTLPAMDSFKQYIKCYVLPQSVYLDKLNVQVHGQIYHRRGVK